MEFPQFETGIPELDLMLGIKSEKKDNTIYNRIALIKGGPGSGKTTLGLQILNNHLKRNEKKPDGNHKFVAGYVSLEIEQDVSCEYAQKNFNFTELKNDNNNFYINSKEELIESIGNFYNPEKTHPPKLSDVLFDCLINSKKQKIKNDDALKIIFIDSLNVLIDIIRSAVDKNINERDIIKSICDIKRGTEIDSKEDVNIIFLFSVEYHPSIGQTKNPISESFMCDTEILLSIEPIFASHEKNSVNISSLGYKIEGNQRGERENEYRSFCKVLKTRFANHQTRRCSYDIIDEEGLRFYESFPGDGQISLFYENSKQKEAWESFFIEDIPHQFPALRHENFDRKQMQQNFSNRRRFMKVPEKTDLYLSSYDNYWIHWFTNVEQKNLIREFIQEESKSFKVYLNASLDGEKEIRKKNLEPLINYIHNFFLQDKFITELRNNINTNYHLEDLQLILNKDLNEFEFLFTYNRGSSNLTISKNNKTNRKKNLLNIKYTCIYKVEEILFTSLNEVGEIERKVIKLDNNDYSANIIRNNSGVIILLMLNELPSKIIFANSFHQKIEFKTKGTEGYLLFDSRYNTTYKSRRDYNKNYDVIYSMQFNQLEVKDNHFDPLDYFNEPNEENEYTFDLPDASNAILSQFYNDKKESDIQNAINIFSSKKNLKCIACNCLDNLYFNEKIHDNIIRTKLYEEILKIRSMDCKLNGSQLKETVKKNWSECSWVENIKKILGEDFDFGREKNDNEKSESPISILDKKINTRELSKSIEVNTQICDCQEKKCIYPECPKESEKCLLKFYKKTIDNNKEFQSDFANLFLKLLQHSEKKSFLANIKSKKLKIFGERKSDIIKELQDWDYKNNRPIHFRQSLFGLYDKDNYLSIPYNANVGIFVYRKDILNVFYKTLKDDSKTKDNYCMAVISIYKDQMRSLDDISDYEFSGGSISEDDIKKIIHHSIIDQYPKTWEEIFAIYQYFNNKNEKKELVLDVQTTDTYYCTFLELLWNCGGSFNVLADYTINDKIKTEKHLLHAYSLLAYMYYSGILPENSTNQPEVFAKRYNSFLPEQNSKDWIFGRFWYTTLIELFHTKKPKFNDKYVWDPTDNNELGLMPMPVTISKYFDESMQLRNPNEVEHCAAWGDWHLGIKHGSENMKLGKDIIDHLMSSRKIIENANNNAILPTTEDFYKLFKNTNCFTPSHRGNITMPNTSYKEIRYKYFRHAQSRSQIYDYRHCMIELNTIIKFIENVAIRDKESQAPMSNALPEYIIREIDHLLKHAIRGIENLIKLDNN